MHINEIINNQIITPTCSNLTKIPYFLSTIRLVYISHYGYVTKLLLQDEEGYCKWSLRFTLRACYYGTVTARRVREGGTRTLPRLTSKDVLPRIGATPPHMLASSRLGSQTSYQIWSYITFNWHYSYTHIVLAFLRMMLSLYLLNPTLDSGFLSLHQ